MKRKNAPLFYANIGNKVNVQKTKTLLLLPCPLSQVFLLPCLRFHKVTEPVKCLDCIEGGVL